MTEASVYAADQLFATLDPTLRQIKLPPVGDVIIADTVGFIRDLPHDLIAAFRATLEETCEADLLLHVIDCSHPNYHEMIANVNTILQEMGADHVPCIEVYNKIDLCENKQPHVDTVMGHYPERVWVSAALKAGIPLLLSAITHVLQQPLLTCTVVLDASEHQLRAALYEIGAVKSETMNDKAEYLLELQIRAIDCHRLLPGKVITR